MASQDTKCRVVMPRMRPTEDGGKRKTPQHTRVNAPSVPVTQSHVCLGYGFQADAVKPNEERASWLQRMLASSW